MMSKGALAAASLLCAAVVAACTPCSGFTACQDRAHLTVTGRILHEASGAPASGVFVDFLRTGGTALDGDSIRAVTDDDGLFLVTIGAPGPGAVAGEMALRSAPGASPAVDYRVFDLNFRVTGDAGDANVLPVWSTRPSLPDIAQLSSRDFPIGNLIGVQVEFRRTGGVSLVGSDTFRTVSGPTGVFPLFDRQVAPADAGEVIGDLAVDVQGFVAFGYRVRATPEYRRNAMVLGVEVTGPAARAP